MIRKAKCRGQFTFCPLGLLFAHSPFPGQETEQPSPARRGVRERGRFEIDWRRSSAPLPRWPRTADNLDTLCTGKDRIRANVAIPARPSRYRRSATSSTFPSPEGEGFVSPPGNSKLSPAPTFHISISTLIFDPESEVPGTVYFLPLGPALRAQPISWARN